MSVTLRDVAVRAGVSPATVSRALNPSASAAPRTRDRIIAIASEMGYVGNNAARSLRTSRSNTIGLLIPDVRNPFFTDLAYAVDKAAARAGLAVMIGNADEDGRAQDRYLVALERHRIDGLLVVPQGPDGPVLRRAVAAFPAVAVDRDAGLGIPVVASDSEGGMQALIDHAVALGHRRIAVVAGPQVTSTGRERMTAASRRLAHYGLAMRPDDVVEGDFRPESGVAAAHRLLNSPRPDAIIAADALMAFGVLSVCRDLGLQPGRDIGVAAFDDIRGFDLLAPPVTAVAQNTEALGRRAVSALLDRIAGREVAVERVPTRLVVRRSLGEPAHVKEVTHG